MNQSVEVETPANWRAGWQVSVLSWCLDAIVDSRAIIGLSVAICIVLALLRTQGPPIYKVEALLIQNSEPTSSLKAAGSSSPLSVVFGGAAASMPEIDEFQILLGSPEVATILDKKYNLLHDVFRGSWDAKNNRWYQPGLRDRIHDRVIQALGGVPQQSPNDYDLAKFLGSNVQFSRSAFGTVMSISMYSDRPDDAKRWLGIILYEVSDIIRSQMINERQNYVNYLQQRLSESSLTTSREGTISILADQYRALMVLESAKTFPLQQIQAPTTGQYPVNKSVSLFMMYGIVSGLLIAGILIACGVRDATFWKLFSRVLRRRS